jgi:plastocyanin
VKRVAAGLAAGALATGTVGLAAAVAPAQMNHGGGAGGMAHVAILAASYAPEHVDVVAGDMAHWDNASVLHHTVTADDGSFGSGQLLGGDTYDHRFAAPGVVTYHCTVHAGMHGEVDVHRLLLDAPREPGAPGRPYVLRGRSSLPAGAPVTIERDAGAGFVPVASTSVSGDGRIAAPVRSPETARFRALLPGGEASPPVRLLIVNRRVTAFVARSAGRRVVRAAVTPASPGATVVLQVRQRAHFGWWPVARTRLDRHSRARFVARVGRSTAARVVLTLRDGATILARSPIVSVGAARGR